MLKHNILGLARPKTGFRIKGSRLREKYRNEEVEDVMPDLKAQTIETQSLTPSIFFNGRKSMKTLKRDHKSYLLYLMDNINQIEKEMNTDFKAFQKNGYNKNDLGTLDSHI